MKLARYDYNALGKPVVKYLKNTGGSWAVSSYFIWDRDQLLLELDSLGNRKADYVYFPGTSDQPAAQTIGATSVTAIRDFRFDGTGSVIGTVQGTGVSQKVAYSQWGGPDFTGNSDNHLMWKGLLYNEDVAGLIYMRGRWYDPAEGRFYNEDPIGHAGGENLYSFNDNDPINGSDPSGLTRQCSTVSGQYMTGDIHGYSVHTYSYQLCEDDGSDVPSWGSGHGGGGGGSLVGFGMGGIGTVTSGTPKSTPALRFTPTKTCTEDLIQAGTAIAMEFAGVGILEGFEAFRSVMFTGRRFPTQVAARAFAMNATFLPSGMALLESGGSKNPFEGSKMKIAYDIAKYAPISGPLIEAGEAASSCLAWQR